MPYAKAIANKGWKKAIADDKSLRLGLNVHEGLITYKAVADAFNLEYTPAEKLISA
jgi:alanine dehydrogenase